MAFEIYLWSEYCDSLRLNEIVMFVEHSSVSDLDVISPHLHGKRVVFDGRIDNRLAGP